MTAQVAGIIANAVGRGFTARTILQYISRNFPQYASAIANASAIGFTADKILKHIVEPKGKNPENSDAYLTDSEKTDRNDKQNKRRAALGVGGVALGVGAGLAGLGLRASASGAQLALPNLQNPQLPGGMGPGPNSQGVQVLNTPPNAPQPITNPPVPNAPTPAPIMPGNNIGQQINNQINQPTNPGQVATAAQAIPQQQPEEPMQQGMQPQEQTQPQSIFEQLLGGVDIESLDPSKKQQLTFLGMIADQLQGQGKTLADPEFKKLADKVKKTIQGKGGMLMEEITRGSPKDLEKEEIVNRAREELKKRVEPKSIVSTPHGVGEVKGVSNGKALVEIDGKTHKIDEKEIEAPPIPEKDLADLHNDLIAGIEKATGQEVSRHIDYVGYDPDANELLYKPWGGTSYTLNDIEPEDVEMLTNHLTQRKTTGSNWIGGWDAETDSPIGAAMHTLLAKLKAKAKEKGVKEYTRKYQNVYSAREPAEEAAKLKKKLAEQERKKREKDAKKAKK